MDETYVKVRGQWMYLYRAVDQVGQTVEFHLSRRRDRNAAKTFLRRLWCKLGSGVNGAFLALLWKEVLVLTRPERAARDPAWMLLVRPAC